MQNKYQQLFFSSFFWGRFGKGLTFYGHFCPRQKAANSCHPDSEIWTILHHLQEKYQKSASWYDLFRGLNTNDRDHPVECTSKSSSSNAWASSLWVRQYLGDSVQMIEIIQSNKCTSKSPASNSQLWARQYLGDSTESKRGFAIKSGQASLHITLIKKLVYFSEMI